VLILASRSPRRAELLRSAGFDFDVFAVDVDETPRDGESPRAYVERLAIAKARAVAARHAAPGTSHEARGTSHEAHTILAADTTVVLDGEILGKPVDAADAARMLRALSGRDHDVLTGVAVIDARGLRSAVDTTRVWFRDMTDEDIRRYVESGEPMDKAGAYGIQGLASRFIPHLEGSYTNVVGLPVTLVRSILEGTSGQAQL
jgi:septum formation protein